MSDPLRYTYSKLPRDDAQLDAELRALGVPSYLGLCGGADSTVHILFSAELTAQQLGQVSTAVAAHVPAVNAATLRSRAAAKAALDAVRDDGVLLRGLLKLLIDELNILRQRDRDRAVDVAAATSLTNLQTRWAARAALNDRTAAQARNALKSVYDAGDADL